MAKRCERKYNLKKRYGMTLDEFMSMLRSQGYRCKVCRRHHRNIGGKTKVKRFGLNVDHCHRTGKVRGLLCNKCNYAVHIVEKWHLSRLLDYIVKSP